MLDPLPTRPHDSDDRALAMPWRDGDKQILDLATRDGLQGLADGVDVPAGSKRRWLHNRPCGLKKPFQTPRGIAPSASASAGLRAPSRIRSRVVRSSSLSLLKSISSRA